MDQIQFRTSNHTTSGSTVEQTCIDIIINGRNLINITHDIELPYAQQTSRATDASNYIGLALGFTPPKRHFLGQDLEEEDKDEKIKLLRCADCGIDLCWSLKAKITVTETEVVWSEFEQSDHSEWDYGDLKYIFDKTEYLNQLQQFIESNKQDFQAHISIREDKEFGWAIFTNSAFEFFESDGTAMLQIENDAYPCQIIDAGRAYWFYISPKSLEDIEPWEMNKRIIYLPDHPTLLKEWLNSFFDVNLHMQKMRNRVTTQIGTANIDQIEGDYIHLRFPATVKIIEPDQLFQLEPDLKFYKRLELT